MTVAKRISDDDDSKVTWDQFLGILQRGKPESLVIEYLPVRTTSKRAPGPGPITKQMWQSLGPKWLKDRKVILHTDAAKSYAHVTIPGVKHTKVIHQKKKVGNRWVKPAYVKLAHFTLEDSSALTVKAGTQLIDGWWRILRRELALCSKSSTAMVKLAVSAAQFTCWHRGENIWEEVGKVIQKS